MLLFVAAVKFLDVNIAIIDRYGLNAKNSNAYSKNNTNGILWNEKQK